MCALKSATERKLFFGVAASKMRKREMLSRRNHPQNICNVNFWENDWYVHCDNIKRKYFGRSLCFFVSRVCVVFSAPSQVQSNSNEMLQRRLHYPMGVWMCLRILQCKELETLVSTRLLLLISHRCLKICKKFSRVVLLLFKSPDKTRKSFFFMGIVQVCFPSSPSCAKVMCEL